MRKSKPYWKPSEFDAIVKEVTERCKDIFYMSVGDMVRQVLTDYGGEDFTLTQNVHMVRGDIKQMVGRIRRTKK